MLSAYLLFPFLILLCSFVCVCTRGYHTLHCAIGCFDVMRFVVYNSCMSVDWCVLCACLRLCVRAVCSVEKKTIMIGSFAPKVEPYEV